MPTSSTRPSPGTSAPRWIISARRATRSRTSAHPTGSVRASCEARCSCRARRCSGASHSSPRSSVPSSVCVRTDAHRAFPARHGIWTAGSSSSRRSRRRRDSFRWGTTTSSRSHCRCSRPRRRSEKSSRSSGRAIFTSGSTRARPTSRPPSQNRPWSYGMRFARLRSKRPSRPASASPT